VKNGYTPKEFAYSAAVDHLHYVMKAILLGHYDDELTPSEQKEVISAMTKLRFSLIEKSKLTQ
jgi:hypothetical protein